MENTEKRVDSGVVKRRRGVPVRAEDRGVEEIRRGDEEKRGGADEGGVGLVLLLRGGWSWEKEP